MHTIHCRFDLHDIVTTSFNERDRGMLRRVISIRPYSGASQSGWEVRTIEVGGDEQLSCDSEWYNLVEKAPVVFENAEYNPGEA